MVIFSLESILKSSYWINGMRLKQNEEFHHVNSREISDYSKYEKIESSQNKVECAVFNSKTGKTRINNSFHPFFLENKVILRSFLTKDLCKVIYVQGHFVLWEISWIIKSSLINDHYIFGLFISGESSKPTIYRG